MSKKKEDFEAISVPYDSAEITPNEAEGVGVSVISAYAYTPFRSQVQRLFSTRLDQRMQEASNLDGVIQAWVAELLAEIDLDRCIFWSVRGTLAIPVAQHCREGIESWTEPIELSNVQELARTLVERGGLIINDDSVLRSSYPGYRGDGNTVVCVTVETAGKIRGFVSAAASRSERNWTEQQVALVQLVAGRIAEAINQDKVTRQLRESVREAEALYAASSLLVDTSNLDRLFEQILEAVGGVFGHHNTNIWLVDDATGEVFLVYNRGEIPANMIRQLRVDGPGLLAHAVRTAAIVNVPDARLDPHYIPGLLDTRAELLVPMIVGGRVIAVFNLESPVPGAFTRRDERILSSFADRAARAVEQARLYAQMRSLADRESLASRIARLLHQSSDDDSTFQEMVDGLGACFKLDRCFLADVDSTVRKIRIIHQYREGGRLWPGELDWERWNQVFGVLAGGPVICPDVAAEPRLARFSTLFAEFGMRAIVSAPVIVQNMLRQVLICAHSQPANWSAEDVEMVEALADQVAMAQQRTELYKAEADARKQRQFLSDLLEIARDPVFLLDLERKFSWFNARLAEMTGYDVEELKGLALPDLISANDEAVADHLSALEHLPESFEAQLTRKDQTIRYVLVTSTPIYESGWLSGVLVMLHDVTEVRLAVEKSAQADKLRALGQLAGGIAHNFNNLLTAISGHAQLLKRQLEGHPLVERVEIIERAAADGAAMVKRIKSFSLHRSEFGLRTADLSQVVQDSIDITRIRWQDAPRPSYLKYTLEFTPVMGIFVTATASELREVFVNLIFNALDAMDLTGGLLRIEIGVSGEFAYARFSDTGNGIPSEIKERIFEPFFTTKGAAGTGLGLSGSSTIVERQGGRIEVESEPGAGATFTVWLPSSGKLS